MVGGTKIGSNGGERRGERERLALMSKLEVKCVDIDSLDPPSCGPISQIMMEQAVRLWKLNAGHLETEHITFNKAFRT